MHWYKEPGKVYIKDNNDIVVAKATYTRAADGSMNIDHTFVDPTLRGQGLASDLVRETVKEILAAGYDVSATCPYAVRWLSEHPEQQTSAVVSTTEKLYEADAYIQEFDARVIRCEQHKKEWRIALDRTAFYPEGGGQPADQGVLLAVGGNAGAVQEPAGAGEGNNPEKEQDPAGTGEGNNPEKEQDPAGTDEGNNPEKEQQPAGSGSDHDPACTGNDYDAAGGHNCVRITDVHEKDGLIWHYSQHPLEAGTLVHGKIDWKRRFDMMQNHSGEHIVSGLIHTHYGYDNVGFHMGEKFITIDLNGLIDSKQLSEIEAEVNRYIWQDKLVSAFFASDEEIHSLDYRSKLDLENEVRLVEFPGADLCACCGLHVKTTGQIGLIKLVSVHRFRQGVRIEMLSGKRAFDYLNEHDRQNSTIAVELSSKPENTAEAVGRLKEENFRLRGEIIRLEKEKNTQLADRMKGKGDVLVFAGDLSPVEIRKCADEILNVCGGICVLLSGDDSQGYRYAAGIRDGDIRELVKEMNQKLNGRGGGKPFFAQGSLKGETDNLGKFFQEKGFAILQ